MTWAWRDTCRAMSQDDVEVVKRTIQANNRRDVEIRDIGDRIVAIGRIHARGTESGAETESPWAYPVQFNNGKVILIRTYLDPSEALEAAGLRE